MYSSCNPCQGKQHARGDTKAAGMIWKIEYAGSLVPKVTGMTAESIRWDCQNPKEGLLRESHGGAELNCKVLGYQKSKRLTTLALHFLHLKAALFHS